MSELRSCPKNWFVTLTFRPSSRKVFLTKDGSLLPSKQRAQRAMISVAEFLKRLRFHGGRLRFFCVTEEHKDGFPYIHLLVHAYEGCTKSDIEQAKWNHGFVKAKLCDEDTASYLVKYLTKEHARVRASTHYGKAPLEADKKMVSSKPDLEVDQNLSLEGNAKVDLGAEAPGKGVRGTAGSPLGSMAPSQGEMPSPEGLVRAMMYNREIELSSGTEVLSTLLELATVEDSYGSGPIGTTEPKEVSGDTGASPRGHAQGAPEEGTPGNPVKRRKGATKRDARSAGGEAHRNTDRAHRASSGTGRKR